MEKTHPATSWPYVIILTILVLAGFALCAMLMKSYMGGSAGLMQNEWFCGSESVESYGCSGVFASRYGKLFGMPLPALGEAYFGAVLVWLLLFGRRTVNVLFALLMAAGGLASLSMLYILFFVLPGHCRWCLLVHLTNGLMILTTLVAILWYRGLQDIGNFRFILTKAALTAFIVLAAMGWVMSIAWGTQFDRLTKQYEAIRLSEPYQRSLYASQKPRDIRINDGDHIRGNPSAPVRIVVYQDYQCEHCLKLSDLLQKVLETITGANRQKICIMVRHYPLCFRCNKGLQTNPHPYACSAAQAAEAVFIAGGEKAFWTYHDLLHKNFTNLDRNPYLTLAKQLGISEAGFQAALKNPKVKEKVEKDAASLVGLGYKTVPAVFINGRFVDGWQAPNFIANLVKEELASARTATTQPALTDAQRGTQNKQ